MNKIFTENFRAFKEKIEINLTGTERNILIYGENGAGKSSIYDALELFFFYQEMDAKAVADAVDQTDENQKRNDWLTSYLCKMSTSPDFTLRVNDNDYSSAFDRSSYEVFMISNKSMPFVDRLSIKKLLTGIRLSGLNIDTFLANENNTEMVVSVVNDALEKDFWEQVQISFDQAEDFGLVFTDLKRNRLTARQDLSRHFNEAKIKLVSLLVLFTVADMTLNLHNNTKKKIIVMDDIVNSLDASNRTLLMKYIFKIFKGENIQMVVMTHNVSYYNLWMFYTSEIKVNSSWKCINLFVSEDKHKLLDYVPDNIGKIKSDYESNNGDPTIGNRLRQHFERLLYELSKILQVGPFYESADLISSIVNKRHIYLNVPRSGKANDGYRMLEDIRKTYKYWTPCDWKVNLEKKLTEYNATNDFNHLKSVIDDVVLYQKVALHQSSHGHAGINTISDKEIRSTIYLLEQMENAVRKNKDKNVYTI